MAVLQDQIHLEPVAVPRRLRANLGRVILLGLEVLIIADIIRTIVVDQSLQSVGVLGLIVVIRIVLSFSLEVEIDGAWPWSRWRPSWGSSQGRARVADRLSRRNEFPNVSPLARTMTVAFGLVPTTTKRH